MTQLQTATRPLPAGSEHRVKLIPLTVHNASATCWGRPWRRRALSLPATRELTFKGIRLPPQALRSWLHLLAKAGLLARRPAPASVLTSPMDPDESPTMSGLGFELCADMILDFTQVAHLSRLKSEEAQAAHSGEQPDASEQDQAPSPPHAVAEQGEDALQGLGPAERVSPDSMDLEFLSESLAASRDAMAEPADLPPIGPVDSFAADLASPEPQEAKVSLSAGVQAIESSHDDVMGESPVATDVAPSVLEAMALSEPQKAEAPDVAQDEPAAVALAEPPILDVQLFPEPHATEAPAVVAQDEPAVADADEQLVSAVESSPEPQTAEVPAVVAQDEPAVADADEQPVSAVESSPGPHAAEAPVVVAQGEPALADADEQPVSAVESSPEPQAAEAPAVVAQDEPAVADADEQPVSAVESSPEPQAAEVPAVVEQDEPAIADADEQPTPETELFSELPEPEASAVVAVAECADVELSPDPVSVADEPCVFEFLDAMVSSLEEVGNAAVIGAATTADGPAAHAVDASMAANSNLETTVLQGILIQKESLMTEMHDVIPEAETPGISAPISSAELQEVAAALSVPQLDADPDDVLSDVQSTLNSLAGMAQGLSQQKQAAGRLQEELEEWNNQLQERERLATDKEERLLQLENHLKEAKANLDRMASENNRLLAERSEALKELAQTVDLRDKATLKRAESIQLEQQRIDEQSAALRARASELDERESSLKRKSEELGVRLKQLQSAKDKFSAIVKSFNETVQFNSTLSAISKTVVE